MIFGWIFAAHQLGAAAAAWAAGAVRAAAESYEVAFMGAGLPGVAAAFMALGIASRGRPAAAAPSRCERRGRPASAASRRSGAERRELEHGGGGALLGDVSATGHPRLEGSACPAGDVDVPLEHGSGLVGSRLADGEPRVRRP